MEDSWKDALPDEDDVWELPARERQLVLDFRVDRGQEPLRIDKFLLMKLSSSTRSKIQQALDDGDILVNEKPVKANYKVRPEDHILAYAYREPDAGEVIPEPIPLQIVFEDEDIMVVYKPPGLVVHPGHGNRSGTLVNGVAWHWQQQHPDLELPERVGLVHRIDKDTSGLLVLGKTPEAIHHLVKQFSAHTVQRVYHALVWGDMEAEKGTVHMNIGRHERYRKLFAAYPPDEEKGKPAITHYRVLERFHYVTLLECKLETGRTHQIRVHLQHIGHTLFNDETYGGNRILKGTIFNKYKAFVENCFTLMPRQALHAKTLGFRHPRTGEALYFDSPLPDDFQQVLDRWRTYIQARKPN